ncbi:GNAT family N-acetyltransferase [Actinospongicola halichondriae]|uniref:GNAT family N-acetyltransferase n=1 Tax=Actinospongicola halichondriae TaxID=3236844 RepID=UPI003D4EE261
MLPTPPDGLRHWRLADAPALAAAWADPSIRLWNPPPDDADATSWIMRCEERWSLGLSVDFVIDVGGAVAGEVGLRNFTDDPSRAELGVWVASECRRDGLAGSSVSAVTSWAHEHLDLDQVWCRSAADNEPAAALFSSLGWQRLGESGGRIVWSEALPGPARFSP